jgi:two-component system, NarL family, sensor histidine kinase DesK
MNADRSIYVLRGIALMFCVVAVVSLIHGPTADLDSTLRTGLLGVIGGSTLDPGIFRLIELLLLISFLACFWFNTKPSSLLRAKRRNLFLLGGHALLALFAAPTLLPAISGEAGGLLPPVWGLVWIFLQTVVQVLIESLLVEGHSSWTANTWASEKQIAVLFVSALFNNLLAFGIGTIVLRHAKQRMQVTQANIEIRMVHQMELQTARIAERLHIAQELHDAVGHSLTALSIRLQFATKVASGEAKEPVEEAYALTQKLLREVRSVVSEFREEDFIDLNTAMNSMVKEVEGLKIDLDIDSSLTVTDSSLAHTLFRCAQEAITNTLRHSEAQHLTLKLRSNSTGVFFEAEDDGTGAGKLIPGSGLTGIKERVARLEGTADFFTAPGSGFRMDIFIPNRKVVLT